MKIGLYMAYAPSVKEFTLKKEGLGRYLSFLLKAFIDNGDEVVIACPRWCLGAVDELMEENNISSENVEFVVPKTDPALYRLYMLIKKKKKVLKNKRKGKIKLATYKIIEGVVDSIISTFSIFKIVMSLLGIIIICVLSAPIILFLLVLMVIYWGIKKIILRLFLRNNDRISFKSNIKQILKNNSYLNFLYTSFRRIFQRQVFQEKTRKASASVVIRKINYMKKKPNIWYCHTAFWTEFCNIKGIKVVCVPDLVTTEFPFSFSRGEFTEVTKNVSENIKNSKYFITYSEYLKNTLLVNQFGKTNDNITVIKHAQNDMLPFIDLKEYFEEKNFVGDVNECFVKDVLFKYLLMRTICCNEYISDEVPQDIIDIRDMDYIFYPSQVRGNKNMLTLLKAYKFLLREKNIAIKLFLTCNYEQDDEIKQFICENRLQYDVISFNNVSNQELAALYFGAKIVVNPTFYEGGFPFTFGEGMSVKTPSIMSDIPQVREVLQNYGIEKCRLWLFDPLNYIDLSKKIMFGLENREKLYKEQIIIYNDLKQRTWNDVSKEYVEAFQRFIQVEA